MPPELPGSVAGDYKWPLTPGRWPFWCFSGCFMAKQSVNFHTGGDMTKLVAAFRSGVIEDSAIWCYFPLSAGISPHGRYQPHGQWRHLEVDATGRDRAYGWLFVSYHVSGVSRPGRFGHSDPQRPSTGSIWRSISRTTGGVGFCPLDRTVGVDPELSNRYVINGSV
jgi:hypothetical protein